MQFDAPRSDYMTLDMQASNNLLSNAVVSKAVRETISR